MHNIKQCHVQVCDVDAKFNIFLLIFASHIKQNVSVEFRYDNADFKSMRLCYLQQEILAPREKSYGQGDSKAKKIRDKRNAIKLTKLCM